MTLTEWTLLEKLLRLLTGFKGTIRPKKYLCVFTHPIAIILKLANLSI